MNVADPSPGRTINRKPRSHEWGFLVVMLCVNADLVTHVMPGC